MKNPSLFKLGLYLFPIGIVVNMIFMQLHIGGLLRELSRLTSLVGFFLIVFGGIYLLFARKKKQ